MDDLETIMDSAQQSRRGGHGCLASFAIMELSPPRRAFVPINCDEEDLIRFLVGLGAICKRRRATRLWVAGEGLLKNFNSEEEADAYMEKYPNLDDIPPDDRTTSIRISEIVFARSPPSRIAEARVHGFYPGITFGESQIRQGHDCQFYHPIMHGWKTGIMPPETEIRFTEDSSPSEL